MAKLRAVRGIAAFLFSIKPRKALLVLLLLAAMGSVAAGAYLLSPVQWWGEPAMQRVFVAPGSTARTIAQQLEDSGLIRSAAAFRLLCRLTGISGQMQAGVYDISPTEKTWRIMQRLQQGDDVDLSIVVTIPEGYTVKQIANHLEAKGIVAAADFLAYLETAPLPYDFLEQQLQGVEPARRYEGFLFPDSYHLLPDSTPEEVVGVMTRRFRQVVESLAPLAVLEGGTTEDTPEPMNLAQLVTLASIVEREALLDEERPTIAGVFYNRLQVDQALQSCATVQYILELNKPVLSTADTKIDSPYNTYIRIGLTPGPIAAPGLHSLQAALAPEDTEYFYFYAIPNGGGHHAFSRTFAEHNQTIRSLNGN
ncbi:MAG: endolytic transglycosylase MltG [Bacillota bacterium]|jgi:UPF0755 protein